MKAIRNQLGITTLEVVLATATVMAMGVAAYAILQAKPAAETTVNTPAPVTHTFKVKEMGIQLAVPDSLKNLTYTFASGKNKPPIHPDVTSGATFTLKPNGNCSFLGLLVKAKGQYKAAVANRILGFVKQFSDFYIAFPSSGGSPCDALNSAVEKTYQTQQSDFRKALESITEIK